MLRNKRLKLFQDLRLGVFSLSFVSVFILVFITSVLAIRFDLFRGNYELFKTIFTVTIALCCLEFALGTLIAFNLLCFNESSKSTQQQTQLALFLYIYVLLECLFGLISSIILVADFANYSYSESYGCINGFGCANIVIIFGK